MRVAKATVPVPNSAVRPDQAEVGAQSLRRPLSVGVWLALVLGLAQVAVVVGLVLVELAQPAPEPGFGGIAFSNAIVSWRSRAGVDLFRDRLGWPVAEGAETGWRTLSPQGYLWGKRVGVAALAILQAGAVLACLRSRAPSETRRVWPWLLGPGLASVILLAIPPVSSDVFYYAAAGHLANEGVNPYLTAPVVVPAGEPFAPYNDWAHIATPYGPVWTEISRWIVALTGPDPFRAVLGFKVVAGLSAIGLAAVASGLARRLRDDTRLAAGVAVLVGWQPVLLLESAGAAHLDATMMLLALGGLWLISSGRPGGVRYGLLVIAAGALVKPVVAPLLGLAALWRLSELSSRRDVPALIRRWLGDAAAILALIVLALAPYWSGGELGRVLSGESKRLYLDEPLGVNAFWFWLLPRLPGVPEGDPWLEITHAVVRPATAFATLALLAGAWTWLLTRSWRRVVRRRVSAEQGGHRGRGPLRDQVLAWAVATAALGLLPVNAHAWYAIWPLAPVALGWATTARQGVGQRRAPPSDTHAATFVVPWWLWLYLAWSLVSFLVYHTHVWPGPEAE